MQENNPKKSKAFIITFILILLLLIAGYYMFKNRNQMFGTKGSTSLSKIFSPLLGTPKNTDLTVTDDGTGGTTNIDNTPKRTGTVITDANGNKMVLAEAGEDLKKGDVLYISGFNSSGNPIVMKAIANDKAKSLVFGVAGEDMKMGTSGNIIIEGILSGVPTNRKEGTLWAAKNPLYLSDIIYGGMTKNPPKSPSYTVFVGSVIKVDAINGSIQIGGTNTNVATNRKLLRSSSRDMQDYWSSIYEDYSVDIIDTSTDGTPPVNPITLPDDNYGNTNIPSVRVTATPSSIEKNGYSVITWTSTNTASCTIYGGGILDKIGTSNTTGIRTRELASTTSVVVSCKGTDDSFVSGAAIINVSGSNTNNLPTVDIQANPTTVKYTETSTITWTSTKAKSCTISGGGISTTGISNTKGVKTRSLRRVATNITAVCIGTDGSAVSDNVTVRTQKDTITTPPTTSCPSPKITDTDGSCINISDCRAPKIVSGSYCIEDPNANKCLLIDQTPLTFTPEQQAKLAELLRKFYILAPKIKTEDDIISTYDEKEQYTTFISQVESLTNQCYQQLKRPGYVYPTIDQGGPGYDLNGGNPWYKSNERTTYITEAQAQGFCYGVVKKGPFVGQNCSVLTPAGADACIVGGNHTDTDVDSGVEWWSFISPATLISTLADINIKPADYGVGKYEVRSDYLSGCQWLDPRDYEKILNVW